MIIVALLFFTIVNASILNKGLLRVAIWNANSGLELKEVCRNDKMDILIVEGLQVQQVNKGKSQCLKMIQMGLSKNSYKPFPHIYRFTKEKEKGAVYADFLEVSELGRALESCKRRKVKVLIQVKIGREIKFTRRQSILMSTLLWDSFFYPGDYYDRPFGNEITFDGIHFAYEKETFNLSKNLMKRVNEMAKIDKRKIILSSEGGDINTIPADSNFIITSADWITQKKAPENVPFVVKISTEESKTIEKFKNYKMFKGTVLRVNKKSRLTGLRTLMSRNPNSISSGISVFVITIIATLMIIFLFIVFYTIKRKLSKELKSDSPPEIE